MHGLRELVGEPAAESVIRRLHAIPVGRWLKADPGRRGYTSEEWISLIQHLQSPIALVEAPTIPPDNPLPVSALLQIPSRGLLVCGCANDSTLDRVEHMIDGPTSMPQCRRLVLEAVLLNQRRHARDRQRDGRRTGDTTARRAPRVAVADLAIARRVGITQ